MPATLPPIDERTLGSLKSGDESALERLFRSSYVPLVDEAAPVLEGDRAAAARAVEHVFVQAWQSREDLESAKAFEADLHAATHDEAARLNSRHHMAHRLDEFEGGHAKAARRDAPPVDVAWTEVHNAIHPKALNTKFAVAEATAHARHEAAEQLTEIAHSTIRPAHIIIGILLLGAMLGGVLWFGRPTDAEALTSGLAAREVRTSATLNAEQSTVSLTDGSKARLGAATQLRVPPNYGSNVRGMELVGTADFTVQSGDFPHFVVKAGPALITATGTAFTVRAYQGEKDVTIRVREGTVDVTVGDSTRSLSAGNALVVSRDSTMRVPDQAELDQTIGWVDGTILVSNRSLKETLPEVKRWYGIEFFVSDTALLSRPVTMRGSLTSSKDAIESLQESAGVKKGWEGTNQVLKDARKK